MATDAAIVRAPCQVWKDGGFMPGPKPKPTVLKKLHGTYRADRCVDNEATFPTPIRMPSPPEGLNEDGAKLWRSLGKLLLDAGLYTSGDQIALELLCLAYGRMKEANRRIEEEGMVLRSVTGGFYQNPFLSIVTRSMDQVVKLLAEFGLTPAERTRVLSAVKSDREPDLAELLFSEVNDG